MHLQSETFQIQYLKYSRIDYLLVRFPDSESGRVEPILSTNIFKYIELDMRASYNKAVHEPQVQYLNMLSFLFNLECYITKIPFKTLAREWTVPRTVSTKTEPTKKYLGKVFVSFFG